jgi:hypothetical protein
MADRSGYIGRAPGDSSVVVARQSYTVAGSTTEFTFASGYTVGYIDAYLNGARLIEGSDYTATDGSTVTLSVAASSGDVLELVAYKALNLITSSTTGDHTVSGDLSVSGTATITGLIDGNISGQIRLEGTAPASASSTGTTGDIRFDSDFIYVCVATNTWKRVAIATF